MACKDLDLALALSLQDKYNSEDVQILKETRPPVKGIVDKRWELADPNPDVHKLFVEYDSIYFWGRLVASGVAVDWSKRMTMCAGVCSYENRGGFCSIRLSLPLLKLRPRKDLVETLLHEMIHAYLFVTHNNKDHDGHGPEFLSHMHRINNASGTRITVYHTFHQEVKEYRQHWWKCSGPCQHKPPFFGLVMRATNRAPSPRDHWWDNHQRTCGGNFAKTKEPEGYRKKGKGGRGAGHTKGGETGNGNIREMLGGTKKAGNSSQLKDGGTAENPSIEAFRGRGFVLGKGMGEPGRGKKQGTDSEVVFGGQGFVLGSGAGEHEGRKLLRGREEVEGRSTVLGKRGREDCDEPLRRKMRRAVEERAAAAIHRGSRNGNGKKEVSNPAKNLRRGTARSKCIIISEDSTPEKIVHVVPSTPPVPKEHRERTIDSPPAVYVIDSPEGGHNKPTDYRICPVCGMGNIPAAIINIHTALCLEAEEEFRNILDDEDL